MKDIIPVRDKIGSDYSNWKFKLCCILKKWRGNFMKTPNGQ